MASQDFLNYALAAAAISGALGGPAAAVYAAWQVRHARRAQAVNAAALVAVAANVKRIEHATNGMKLALEDAAFARGAEAQRGSFDDLAPAARAGDTNKPSEAPTTEQTPPPPGAPAGRLAT